MIELSMEQLEGLVAALKNVRRNSVRIHHVSFRCTDGVVYAEFFVHEDKTGGVHRLWWNDKMGRWLS